MTPEDYALFDALMGSEFHPTAPWWGVACAMVGAKRGNHFLWASGKAILSFAYGYEFACALRCEYSSTMFLNDSARLRTPMGHLVRHLNSAASSLPRTLPTSKDPLWITDFIADSPRREIDKLQKSSAESPLIVFFKSASLAHVRKKVTRALDGLRLNGSMRETQHERLRLRWYKESKGFLNEHPRALTSIYWKTVARLIK
ncbi:hypothetical protein XU18_3619 [Perkinsela sp. CCAP 1560/4]|nr:hypothetical protein XU18_3979 [Perkinsela sp. CCAP 1560/4]KNH05300.1 hypothetical protein XU18_3619 [Perkinsela sp. CCAP 1560/4]|eukprot:KNH04882.1 hypothetical protein XU18_3979 [Perkinsela sp. CCAP 1560/4]